MSIRQTQFFKKTWDKIKDFSRTCKDFFITTFKKINSWIKDKTICIKHKHSLISIVIVSVFIAFVMFCISPGSGKAFLKTLLNTPSLFFLNYLPIILFMMLTYLIFNNSVLGLSTSSALFVSLSIISRVKIQMRQDPLLPTDVSLISEIFGILNKFNSSFITAVICIMVIAVFLILISFLFFKGQKMDYKIRLGGIFAILLISLGLNTAYYKNVSLYESYGVEGNYYFKVNHFVSKGFMYSFIYDFNSMQVKIPVGYDTNVYEATKIPSDLAVYENTEKPHIIMIMGEAFSDLSENDNINFTGYDDPLYNYKKLTSDEDTISGHIAVPVFGGGTSDTEFDVLSACLTSLIENSLQSYSFIRKNFDALPTVLSEIGYSSVAIHPGYPWFYNRANVYSYMGFESFIHLENGFDEKTQSIAGYISEDATADKIIEVFEGYINENNSPLFEFCVTIQNHGPYLDKYGIKKNFNTSKNLSDEEINNFSNYFKGVSDCDKAIAKLISYFESIDEPVVVVYFGDHLPGFAGVHDILETLEYPIDINGSAEERINMYKTPYFIWQNSSAKKITSIIDNTQPAALPEDGTISANYLGALLLELLGYNNISYIYDYTNSLRRELPVISSQGYLNPDGVYTDDVEEYLKAKLEYMKRFIYYKIFDEYIE